MAHLANNERVAMSLEALNISRCTTITDWGFQTWSVTSGGGRFSSLYDLKLSDCTFLTDQAIVYLVNAAPNLRKLDLVTEPAYSRSYDFRAFVAHCQTQVLRSSHCLYHIFAV